MQIRDLRIGFPGKIANDMVEVLSGIRAYKYIGESIPGNLEITNAC